jgi:cytochrome c
MGISTNRDERSDAPHTLSLHCSNSQLDEQVASIPQQQLSSGSRFRQQSGSGDMELPHRSPVLSWLPILMMRPPMRIPVLISVTLAFCPTIVQAQDAAAGEKVFAQCKACHQVGPNAKNAVGPVLNGLFGRKAGTVEGYNYSPANKNSGIIWDEGTFAEYIKDPKAKVPGTKMVYAGLKDEQRIRDLTAYLKQFDATGQKAAAADGRITVANH